MSSDLREGALFAGRYRVVRRIAAGGMGAVYEVVHLETDRRRALKVMLPQVLQSDDLRERFKREAKVAAHIESEFIVEVFDAGVDGETRMPFLVMELLKGEELGKRLKRAGRLGPAEVVEYLRQTALALDKTHRANIVHRDLKPENLFLCEREDGPPRVKVLDFGVAKVVAESATAGGATQSIGTPMYMAPEQYNPEAHLSPAADIYALGMVAYTLLVGAAYWAEEMKAGNVYALIAVAMHGPREAASARAARRGVVLPPAFDAWFARITAAQPAYRFATASEAVRALGDALATGGAGANLANLIAPAATFAPEPGTIPLPSPVTGPATTATAPLTPSKSRVGVVAAAMAAAGVLVGTGVFLLLRSSGGAPVPAATAAKTADAAPVATAAEIATATAAPVEAAPTASAAATTSATASATAAPSAAPPVPASKVPAETRRAPSPKHQSPSPSPYTRD